MIQRASVRIHILAPILKRARNTLTSGISIAYARKGKMRHETCGYNAHGRKISSKDLFQAASISKPIAALGILKLRDRGLIDLAAPANAYLKGWVLKDAKGKKSQATILELLSHSAGVNVGGFPGYVEGTRLPTTMQILKGTATTNSGRIFQRFKRGTFHYSGGGFTIMQKIIEDVAGESFASFMRKNVLIPFGMRHSFYSAVAPRNIFHAVGHTIGGAVVQGGYHRYPELAAAGLWTTPADLLQCITRINQLLKKENKKILTGDSLRLLFSPACRARRDTVGLGFFLDEINGVIVAGHDGSNAGFKSKVRFVPGDDRAIVVMTDSDRGFNLADEIIRAYDRDFAQTLY